MAHKLQRLISQLMIHGQCWDPACSGGVLVIILVFASLGLEGGITEFLSPVTIAVIPRCSVPISVLDFERSCKSCG